MRVARQGLGRTAGLLPAEPLGSARLRAVARTVTFQLWSHRVINRETFAHQVRLPEPSTPEERDRIIGVGMAAILVRMNTGARRDGWVHIRVERLSFVDVTTIRRETTLDFTYPVDLTPVAHMLRLAATPLLPLTLLTKDARVAGFSVQDEDDHRLPVLTRVESSAEAARCLVALARTVAPTDGVTPEVAHAFEQVALLPSADACELLARMRVRAQQAAPGAGEKPFSPISGGTSRRQARDVPDGRPRVV